MRGPNVMKGYLDDPACTAEVSTPDGWFRTGDLGRLDGRNRLSIRGRLKPEVLESLASRVQEGIARAEASVTALLERIRKEVNAQLASFSRVHRMELQRVPFEKTPTQKIKRFLYPQRG